MKIFFLLPVMLVLAGCTSPSQKSGSSFFPLSYVEGVPDENGTFPIDRWHWVNLVIAVPEDLKGVSLMIRFKKRDDPDYRLLTANYGKRIRIAAKGAQGVHSQGTIVFVPDRPPAFTVIEEAPDQSLKHP